MSRFLSLNRTSIRQASGFTLVELLVVIAIIGVLVALLLPAVQAAREAARRAQCISQIRQIGIAMHNYESSLGNLPEGTRTQLETPIEYGQPFPSGGRPCNNGPGWTILILPYLEQQALYDRFDLKAPFPYLYDNCQRTPNHVQSADQLGIKTPLPMWQCPSDLIAVSGTLHNSYFACTGGGDWESPHPTTPALGYATVTWPSPPYANFINGITGYDSKTQFGQIEDGTSNTFLLGENRLHYQPGTHSFGPERFAGWSSTFDVAQNFGIPHNAAAASRAINFTPVFSDEPVWVSPGLRATQFSSHHPGGAHFVMADVSARFLSEDIDEELYWSLGRMADGLTGGPE